MTAAAAPYDWRDQASCLEHDQELFFPVGNNAAALRQTEDAKAVCRGCPVMEPCLMWALEAGVVGVWGGLTEDERRALRKRTQRVAARARDRAGHGTAARYKVHRRAGEVACDACKAAEAQRAKARYRAGEGVAKPREYTSRGSVVGTSSGTRRIS